MPGPESSTVPLQGNVPQLRSPFCFRQPSLSLQKSTLSQVKSDGPGVLFSVPFVYTWAFEWKFLLLDQRPGSCSLEALIMKAGAEHHLLCINPLRTLFPWFLPPESTTKARTLPVPSQCSGLGRSSSFTPQLGPSSQAKIGISCHILSVQFSSVAQSCPTLCDPMDCSMPGLPVHYQLPDITQTHVY